MDKDFIHIYDDILLSHKKEPSWVVFCRDVDGPRDCRTGWSKSGREKQKSEVKNPPGKQETQVQPLDWKDPLGRKWQFTPLFLPGKSHGQRSMTSVVHWIIKKNLMDKGAGRSRVRYDLVAEQQQQTYLQSRNRDTDIENKHMGTRGERGEWDELGDWYIYTIDTIYEIDN